MLLRAGEVLPGGPERLSAGTTRRSTWNSVPPSRVEHGDRALGSARRRVGASRLRRLVNALHHDWRRRPPRKSRSRSPTVSQPPAQRARPRSTRLDLREAAQLREGSSPRRSLATPAACGPCWHSARKAIPSAILLDALTPSPGSSATLPVGDGLLEVLDGCRRFTR